MAGLRCENRYRMVRVLGKGSFGEIRVARDEFLGREVAIKVIQPQFIDDSSVLGRFAREAETLAKLEHPHIIPIHDSGRLEDGRPYFSMRLVNGKTFEQRTIDFHDQHPRMSGEDRFALPEFLDLLAALRDTAEAVAFAHHQGIVHRDVKPSNILISQHGEVYLVDWGTSKQISKTGGQAAKDLGATLRPDTPAFDTVNLPSETMHGAILGTPAYMSPEQAMGQIERVSSQSDIFGLGAALYFLLTGRPPHRGDLLAEVLTRAQQGEITSVRSLAEQAPEPLISICDRALAIDPDDRYPTADAFVTDLQQFLESSKNLEARPHAAVHAVDPTRRGTRQIAIVAWFLVAISIAIGAAFYRHFEQASRKQANIIAALERELKDALAKPAIDSTNPSPNETPRPIESEPKYVELQAELFRVDQLLADTQRRLEQLDQQSNASGDLVSESAKELEEANNLLRQRDAELLNLQNELQETRQQLQTARDQSNDNELQVQSLQDQVASLQQNIEEAQTDSSEAQQSLKVRETERDELIVKIQQLQQELKLANSTNDSLRNTLDQQAESMAAIQDQIRFHSHMDGQQLVDLLDREGKTAQLIEPNHVEIKADSIVSQLYIMANGDLLISSPFQNGRWTTEIVNEWNREKILSRAYLDENQHVVLESELTARDGLSDRAVLSFLKSYDESLATMGSFLDGRSKAEESASSGAREY